MREPWVQVKTDSETDSCPVKHGRTVASGPVKCLHGASVRAAEEMKVITVSVE